MIYEIWILNVKIYNSIIITLLNISYTQKNASTKIIVLSFVYNKITSKSFYTDIFHSHFIIFHLGRLYLLYCFTRWFQVIFFSLNKSSNAYNPLYRSEHYQQRYSPKDSHAHCLRGVLSFCSRSRRLYWRQNIKITYKFSLRLVRSLRYFGFYRKIQLKMFG